MSDVEMLAARLRGIEGELRAAKSGSQQVALRMQREAIAGALHAARAARAHDPLAPKHVSTLLLSEWLRALAVAKSCMAKQGERREYLRGVCLTIGSGFARLEATDGRRIARVRVPFGQYGEGGGQWVIKAEAVERMLRMWKAGLGDTCILHLTPLQHGFVAAVGLGEISLDVMDGDTFPRLDRVLPDGEPTGAGTLGIHSPYLADAAKALGAYAKGYQQWATCTLRAWGESAPFCLSCLEAEIWISPVRL